MTPHQPQKGVIIAAILVLLGFFVPWYSTSILELSPFKLVTSSVGDYAFGGFQNILWAIPISAVLLIFNEATPGHPLRGINGLLKWLPFLAWALFSLFVFKKASSYSSQMFGSSSPLGGNAGGNFVLRGISETASGGFYLTMAGVVWLLLSSFTSRPQPAAAAAVPAPVAPPAPIRPVRTGPTTGQLLGAWLNRHHKPVLAVLGALILGLGLYAFLRPNPEADGKRIAQAYCDCEKEYLKSQLTAKQAYLNVRPAPKTAQAKLLTELTSIGQQYTKCRQGVREQESQVRSKYLRDYAAQSTFQEALTEQLNIWYTAESEQLTQADQSLLAAGFPAAALTPVASQLKAASGANPEDEAAELTAQVSVETQLQPTTPEAVPVLEYDSEEENVGRLAVVVTAKAYFYASADLSQPRKAYCVQGDQLALGATTGNAVQATYTTAGGKSVSGWVRKADISIQTTETPRSAEAAADEDAATEDSDAETADLIGTWQGTLGAKPFTLHIESVEGNRLTGWNQVGTNRRPVSGTFTDVREPGSSVAFELALREPGTDKWDGAFDLTLTSPMSNAAPTFCSGTWQAFQGGASKDVTANKE
jgi:hypothetical protein